MGPRAKRWTTEERCQGPDVRYLTWPRTSLGVKVEYRAGTRPITCQAVPRPFSAPRLGLSDFSLGIPNPSRLLEKCERDR